MFSLYAVANIITFDGCSLDHDASLSVDSGVDAAEVPGIDLGDEYTAYDKSAFGKGGGPGQAAVEHGLPAEIALYLPNRFLDLLDVVRFDVGVGPSTGAVLRVTKYAQAGLRVLSPFSIRAGLNNRRLPVFLETANEFGISPFFVESPDRHVATGEIGVGVDLILFGFYVGFNPYEAADFLAGIIGIDFAEDDY